MIQMLERVADPKIVNAVTRMIEKEYGLVHNKDYHMAFLYQQERPPKMKIKLLDGESVYSVEKLQTSVQKIYDHSEVSQ